MTSNDNISLLPGHSSRWGNELYLRTGRDQLRTAAFHARPTASPYWAKHAPLTRAAGSGRPRRFLMTSPSALLAAALGFHSHTTTAGGCPSSPRNSSTARLGRDQDPVNSHPLLGPDLLGSLSEKHLVQSRLLLELSQPKSTHISKS